MPWGFFGTISRSSRRLAVDDQLLLTLLQAQPVPCRMLFAPLPAQEVAGLEEEPPFAVQGLTLSAPIVKFPCDAPFLADSSGQPQMLMEIVAEICSFSGGNRAATGVVLAVIGWGDRSGTHRYLKALCTVILQTAAAHVLLLHRPDEEALMRELSDVTFPGQVSHFGVGDVSIGPSTSSVQMAPERRLFPEHVTDEAGLSKRVLEDGAQSKAEVTASLVPAGPPTTSQEAEKEVVNAPTDGKDDQQQQQHVTLSILPHLDRVLDNIRTSPSRCIILDGPTGCGKSTQVPMALVRENPSHRLWVTQPRRMAALSLCNHVNAVSNGAMEAAFSIGGRSTEQRSSRIVFMTPGVLLKRVKASFRSASFLNDAAVTHILLDEVHERTVETDILCCMLRELVKYNSSVRLVLMSATLSCVEMQLYMHRGFAAPRHVGSWCRTPVEAKSEDEAVAARTNVPIVSIPPHVRQRQVVYLRDVYKCVNGDLLPEEVVVGKTQSSDAAIIPKRVPFELGEVLQGPTQPKDLPVPPSSFGAPPAPPVAYLTDARRELLVALVSFIHRRYPVEQSILIFVSGLAMIERLELEIKSSASSPRRSSTSVAGFDDGMLGADSNSSDDDDVHIITLHSANDTARGMQELFGKNSSSSSSSASSRRRMVIIATNIAESSITVPHVDHVIDTCLAKDQLYSYEDQMPHLVERFASRDSCEQRAGRTGRLRMGTVWRLCTEAEYGKFDLGRMPGMLQSSLLSTILLVADAHVGELDDFIAALPTPPPGQFVASTILSLRDHYGAITLGSIEKPHVSLTSRGAVLASLGIDVPLGHLVLLGLSLDLLMPAVQAAAILSTVGSFVKDDAVVHLIEFDSETGCDVLAFVEVYRAWVRKNTSTHLLLEAETGKLVDSMVRLHVAMDVREKTLDLIKQLDQFGLASPFYSALLENSGSATAAIRSTAVATVIADEDERQLMTSALRWEDAADVAPMSGRDAVSFIALLSLAFVRNTLTTQQTPAQTRVIRRYGFHVPQDLPFVPYHEVSVKHALIPTASDLEALQRWLGPASGAHVARDGESELKTNVRFRVDRIVKYVGKAGSPVQLHDEFACRVVRGTITHDAYKLLKIGREDARRLNIAFCDCPSDTHLVSSWFVEVKAPFFIDRVSLLYPLVADMKNPICPSLVACQLQKRRRHIAVQQLLQLPGGLSYFPLCAALLAHWDGRSLEGHCAVIKTLPHCHPDVKKLERFGVDLQDVILLNDRLRSFYTQQLDQLLSARSVTVSEGIMGARGGGGGAGGFFSSNAQRQEWLAAMDGRSKSNREQLDLILCRYLRDLPPHFAPRAVHEFKHVYRSRLPLQLLVQLGTLRDVAGGGGDTSVNDGQWATAAPQHLLRLVSDGAQAEIRRQFEAVLGLCDPSGFQRDPSTLRLPAHTRANEQITSEMLRDFRAAHSTSGGGNGGGSCYGIPLRSGVEADGGAAAAVPLPSLRFLRHYAQRYLSDQTLLSAFSLIIWPFLKSCEGDGGRGWSFLEPLAETSNGLLSFWALNSIGAGSSLTTSSLSTHAAVSMTSTSVAHRTIQHSFRLLERYVRDIANHSTTEVLFPAVSIWTDATLFTTDHAVLSRDHVLLVYIPPAAAGHSTAGRRAPFIGGEQESTAAFQLEDEENLIRLLATSCVAEATAAAAGSDGGVVEDGRRWRRILVLFLHQSRYAALLALRDADPSGFAAVFGHFVAERLLHDELVGEVVLIVSVRQPSR